MSSRIEAGITVEGAIRGEGELEVAGRVRGALTLNGKLTVAVGGIVEADVEARDIEVAGLLAGSATAHRMVQVLPGGKLEARVKAARLLVDDGALFRGELSASPAATAESGTRSDARRALPSTQPPLPPLHTPSAPPAAYAAFAPSAPPVSPAAMAPPPMAVASPKPSRGEPISHRSGARVPFAAPRRDEEADSVSVAAAPKTESRRPAASVAPVGDDGPTMPSLPRGRSRVSERGGIG